MSYHQIPAGCWHRKRKKFLEKVGEDFGCQSSVIISKCCKCVSVEANVIIEIRDRFFKLEKLFQRNFKENVIKSFHSFSHLKNNVIIQKNLALISSPTSKKKAKKKFTKMKIRKKAIKNRIKEVVEKRE